MRANIPGRNFSSAFSNVACTRTLRVTGSRSGLMAVSRPSNCWPGNVSETTRTFRPVRICDSSCCGNEKSPNTGDSADNETMALPRSTDSPRFTCRMPVRPANGARMVFFSMMARMLSALAWLVLAAISAASNSDCDTVFSFRRFCRRLRLMASHSCCAATPRNCASSEAVSSCTSRSPLATTAPDSKAISFTVPASSGVMVMPWTAAMEPMAASVFGHFSSRAANDETVSGGGAKVLPASISVLICNVFTPARPPKITTTSTRATVTLRFIIIFWFVLL